MDYPSGLLTVDLDALQANWLRLREQLNAPAQCGAVVKANAYGLGMLPVASALWRAGCRTFFVVNLTEGTALRQALGESATIYVLQGAAPGQESEIVRHKLIPVLISSEMIRRWLAYCEAHAVATPVALKTNTGMHRLGLDPAEFQDLLRTDFTRLHCCLLMSHLACADEPSHPLNKQQLQLFQEQLGQVRQLCPGVQGSLANSAATVQGAAWHFDLVRPGIALYGSNPTGSDAHQMEPVVYLQLPVVQSRSVAPGAAVGYGADYVATSRRHLVTVSGGYGDGLFRNLGNAGHVWYRQSLPVIGRVSMDSFVVDVTALSPDMRPSANKFVEVLGSHVGVDAMAKAAGTVAYEILTRLTGRYARRYKLDNKLITENEAVLLQ